jgi:hypothetical protein
MKIFASDLILDDGESITDTTPSFTRTIPKESEAEVLAWFDSQPKNEDGSVTIEHGVGGQSFPPELIGFTREMLKDVPKVKIGARVNQKMIDKLNALKNET